MSVLKQIYQLQVLDGEWEEQAARLAEVEESLGVTDEVAQARQEVAALEQALHDSRARVRALELELGSVNAQWKENQRKLYEGKSRSAKEVSGLEQQSRALARRRSEMEDQQLELMIGIDEQEAEFTESQVRLRQIEAQWQEGQAGLIDEKARLEQRLAELEGMRHTLRKGLPAADLDLYEHLRSRLGGMATAFLRDGICQVCGVDVPTGMALAVQRGEGRNLCPVCGRLFCGGS